MLGVKEAVNAKVAALAGGYNMSGVKADWFALAEVCDGEDNFAVGKVGGSVVELSAASRALGVQVQATLAGTLATSLGAGKAYPPGEV